ncbi:uncharacterized protein LOC119669629 [Teleopsis dalmanni]|uniref:uncharacterized protein LOC119669629 n=1 Tax=Teleopsis dalmanni TaxID=139649 RepID=UPI0018CFDFA1|nr:uncharacterized protein LOC119669629 [Teleopsis dalmanni]
MKTCILCKSKEKDDIRYGEFLTKKDVGVHTYCLYLSSNLCQSGKDNEGFLGFLLSDIRNEVKRISAVKCCYCRGYYANIGCCHKKCRHTFHLVCGVQKGAQNEFCDTFRSFCSSHVRKVRYHPGDNDVCLICLENLITPLKRFDPVNMLRAPCCQNGWFHKYCLQKCAKMSGYFFKCPLCNDTEKIKSNLKKMGVFIPDQDAAWELEPGAFQDLLERPRTCQAITCVNKSGRNNESDRNPLKICITCGSVAIHQNCMRCNTENFQCDECIQIVGKSVKKSNQIYDENSDVEVCVTEDSNDNDIPMSIKFKNEINKSLETQTCHLNNELVKSDGDEKIIAPMKRKKFHVITDDLNNVINDDKGVSSSSEEDLITSFVRKRNVICSDESSCSTPQKKTRRQSTTVTNSRTDESDNEIRNPLSIPSLFSSDEEEEIIMPMKRNKFHVITDDQDFSSSSEEDIITSFIDKKNVIRSDESSCSTPQKKKKSQSTRVVNSSTDSDNDNETIDPLSLSISSYSRHRKKQHIKHTPPLAQLVNIANGQSASKLMLMRSVDNTNKPGNKKESHGKYIVTPLQQKLEFENTTNTSSYLSEIKKLSVSLKNVEHNICRLPQKSSTDCKTNKENIEYIDQACFQENKLNSTPTKINFTDHQVCNCSKNKTEFTSTQENASILKSMLKFKNVTVRLPRLLESIQKTDGSKESNNSSSYCCSEETKNTDSSNNNTSNKGIPIQTSNTVRQLRLRSVCVKRVTELHKDENYTRKSFDNSALTRNSEQSNSKAEKVSKNVHNCFQDNINMNCKKTRTRRSTSKSAPISRSDGDEHELFLFETSCIANRTRRKSCVIKDKADSKIYDEFEPNSSRTSKENNFSTSETESFKSNNYSLKFCNIKIDNQTINKHVNDYQIKHNRNITTEKAVRLQFYTELDAYMMPKFRRVNEALKK